MKIRVEFLNGNEHRNNPQCQSVSHIFDGDTAVKDHIKVLLTHFKIPVEKVGSYALQNPVTLHYIDDAFLTPERLVEAEKSYFILRMRPQAIAQRVIDSLRQNSSTSPTMKDIIFNIRFQMKDVDYVEEFIAKGGINQLLDVIVKSHGNTQAYCLTALRCFMGFHSGLDEVMSRPQIIDKLYSLVSPSVITGVCRQSIELLFVVCNFDGFSLVHRAAKNHALETNLPAYTTLVNLLASGDIETQVNTITLLNCLLDNAPNPRKVEKLLTRWKALGIVKILKSQEHVTHCDFKTQSARFQVMAGIGFETRKRPELVRGMSTQDLELTIIQYQEQQPLVRLLSHELKFLRNAIKSAIENGSYINYRAPTERYDEYIARKNDIIGDGPVNISYLKRSDKFTSAFRKSMYVRSPNTSVLFDSSTLVDDDFDEVDYKSPKSNLSNNNNNNNSTTDILLSPISSEKNLNNLTKSSSNGSSNNNNNNNNNNNHDNNKNDQSSSAILKKITINETATYNLFDVTNTPKARSSSHKSKSNPSKPAITPKKRMKPLPWSRVVVSTLEKDSVWNKLPEVTFDEEQFVELFSLYTEKLVSFNGSPVLSGLGVSGTSSSVMNKKPIQKVISVLSQKRSNAISIMCSKLPSDENLIRALRELDSSKLSLELVSTLHNNIPTQEEMASILELNDDFILDKPERWCLMIDGFPKIKQRLRCWEFMLKFDDLIKNIADSIETVSIACNELKTSHSLVLLLSTLVSLGNYLNAGNQHRGQADGFHLDAFNKILEIRDNQNSGSLLDFAIKTLLNNHPKSYTLPNELQHISNASLINLQEVGNQLSKLSTDYTELTTIVDDIVNTTDSEDPFITAVPRFMNNAYTTLRTTQKQYLDTEKLFNEVLDFFNPIATPTSSSGSSLSLDSSLSSSTTTNNNNNINSSSNTTISTTTNNKYNTEKFFTLFSTIITTFKKSPTKRMSQKGFGLKISDSEDPVATIIDSIKKNIDVNVKRPSA
ncbi:actin binding protein [Heterostelium album PN500]|uniref:Actin binding protein n=1 Tax=Heterostelium pallidum (strain ATCC 26659 / Pp 5 / PN500) TaxID=670386 RepID=D3AZB3_HETP5|nr:actin binding protein [Heterostelium album PN500]EFA85496.1 actin binding protein [Heterostelium album PN500]|eukprot:XP_020437604.1 actin binding protein [Heterostelium album PN500]